jgi:uncharacterized protein YigA (DUF484 family)
MTIQGITEDDIANYLANTPDFFERHAELLASIQLTSPHGQRAVSLQERQMQMLRDKIKGLERTIMEMIRHGQDNVAIAERLHHWVRALLLTHEDAALPATLVDGLQNGFLIPQAALRLWGVRAALADLPAAQAVSADVKSFANSLTAAYCGPNADFEAAQWLPDAPHVASMAMIPLRVPAREGCFGLLVLGSPDPTRYSADMGTEFLAQIGDVAAAALSRLLADQG